MDKLVEYLINKITHKMTLEDMISTFEMMCQIPVENDMILFETGTFDFTGEPLFYFSLVRQFPNEDDEYYQIHMDVLYKPTSQNKVFQSAVWNEDLDEDIFEYIRNSEAFAYAKDSEYVRVDFFMDETL